MCISKLLVIFRLACAGILVITLQGCPREPDVTPTLSREERQLIPYNVGQNINYVENGMETTFSIIRDFDAFTDEVIFSKKVTFPVILISHSPSQYLYNYDYGTWGILFRDRDSIRYDSPPTFELLLPYDKDFNLIAGTTPAGDLVNFLGKVQINGIDYEDVYELKQDAKNFSFQYANGLIEGNQNVVIWYSKSKGLLRFSCTHAVFLNPNEKSEEKIEYLLKE